MSGFVYFLLSLDIVAGIINLFSQHTACEPIRACYGKVSRVPNGREDCAVRENVREGWSANHRLSWTDTRTAGTKLSLLYTLYYLSLAGRSYVPTFCRALQTGPRSAPSNEQFRFPSSRTVTSSISPTSLAAFKKQVQMVSCLPKASCTTQHYFRESSGRCCFPLIRRRRIVQAQNTSQLQMQISSPDNHGMQTSLWSIFASSPS